MIHQCLLPQFDDVTVLAVRFPIGLTPLNTCLINPLSLPPSQRSKEETMDHGAAPHPILFGKEGIVSVLWQDRPRRRRALATLGTMFVVLSF
jgi:hypothetical protein